MDEMQENRRLRAAMDGMRYRQGIARTGAFAGIVMAALSYRAAPEFFPDPWPVWIAGTAVAFVITGLSSVPFLRCACPKCGKPYHGIGSLFGNPESPRPCRSCGFQINRHVSRYSASS